MLTIIRKKAQKGLIGTIEIPPDKSISHRAAMFLSMTNGTALISNFSRGADCLSTLNIIEKLGCEVGFISNNAVKIISHYPFKTPEHALDCGNSGTTMRLMSGILAGQNFESTLFGDSSLMNRPMKRVIEPLELMGAQISHNEYKAPLKISGKNLHGITYNSKLASAQVKSCILLAGLNAEGKTTFTEPYKSRNHTEIMLDYLGADIEINGNAVSIKQSSLNAIDITIPGDISSAAFFMVAGCIVPNSEIIIKNVGLNPTRAGIIEVLQKMGANIEILDKSFVCGEEVGDIRIKYSELQGTEISGDIIPRLIDELPVIAVLATQAEGTTVVKDAQDLRNKESDRIKCLVNELRKIGVKISETEDGFIIEGKQKIKGKAEVECYHDHRLAMSFYVAGLVAEEAVKIKDFQWVDISFPEFLTLMQSFKA